MNELWNEDSINREISSMKGKIPMKTAMWKFSFLAILMVAALVVVGCQSDLEKAAEATVEVQQEKIDDFFTVAEGLVAASATLAGGLPSQEAKAELIVADLEEINSRLTAAVELKSEAKVTALEDVQQLLQKVAGDVEDALSEASDEAQDALKQLQGNLEDAQKAVQDEIDSVKKELGQAVDEAQEEVEAEATTVAEEVESAEEAVESEETPTSSD